MFPQSPTSQAFKDATRAVPSGHRMPVDREVVEPSPKSDWDTILHETEMVSSDRVSEGPFPAERRQMGPACALFVEAARKRADSSNRSPSSLRPNPRVKRRPCGVPDGVVRIRLPLQRGTRLVGRRVRTMPFVLDPVVDLLQLIRAMMRIRWAEAR